MKKIIVTGCFGRIGYRLCQLLHSNYQVIGIDNDTATPVKVPFVDYYLADLGNATSIHRTLDKIFEKHGDDYECVIHLAAYYSFKKGDYEPYHTVTVKGTEILAMRFSQVNLKQFIFSSTMLVYAPCQIGKTITEDSAIWPKWDYPHSKVEAENILSKYQNHFAVVILRFAGCYDEMCHSIPLAHQIDRIYKKTLKSRFYPGNLNCGAPYLHFDDLIQAISLIIEKKAKLSPYEIFLIGEEETLSYLQLQHKIGQYIWNRPWKTWRIPKWLAKMGAYIQLHMPFLPSPFIQPWMIDLTDDHYQLDITKSKQLLGWIPKHSLSQTLPLMIQNLQADPPAWYRANKLKF